jgi:hypothetical protein
MVSVSTRQLAKTPGKLLLGLSALILVFALPVVHVSALQYPQQDWPPDDPVNSPGPQQYQPAPQQYPQQPYGYAPQQYPQNPQYPQAQGYPQQPYPGQSQPYPAQAYPQQGYGQQLASSQQPMSPGQLAQLLAPIALYPDALVAQVLAASTYPAQVSAADQWLQSMGGAAPEQIAAGANAQTSWDPSVKALTAFPQVLAMLDRNLQWTTTLGNAYYNQPQDVLQTIQVLRQRAEQAGNLESSPQEEVSDNQGNIDIAPADPQTVYVPNYNPWNVYGQPVSPYPGFSLLGTVGSFLGNALISYGPGIAMHAFMATPWGWLGWGLDWLAHSILFDHNDYWTRSTSVRDWGFPYGGPRWHGGDWAHNGGGWNHGGYGNSYAGNNGGNYRPRGGPVQPYNNPRSNEAFNGGNTYRPRGEPVQPYADARSTEGFNRGYPSRGEVYGRAALPSQGNYREPQTYGRPQQSYEPRQQAYAARPEQFSRPGYGSSYGSNFAAAPRDSFSPRSGGGMTYANPVYRAQQNTYRGDISGGRGYSGPSNTFSVPQRSGGFHLFGGGHSLDSYKAPKNYGGGRSAWGGSSHGFGGGFKAPKAPKESHSFGGGGHSFGGGHSGGSRSSHHH